jgi:hypothetical protein
MAKTKSASDKTDARKEFEQWQDYLKKQGYDLTQKHHYTDYLAILEKAALDSEAAPATDAVTE